MIRVSRPQEPDALRKTRDVKLARARLDMAAGRKPDTSGYNVARTTLHKALNQKCVYCEQQTALKQLPVEHFRPKAQLVALTKRSEGIVDGGLTRLVDAGRLALNGPCYEPEP